MGAINVVMIITRARGRKRVRWKIVRCYVDDAVLLYLPGFVTIQNPKIQKRGEYG